MWQSENGSATFVVDGRILSTHEVQPGTKLDQGGVFTLGQRVTSSGVNAAQSYSGEMDEVRLWTIARSASDIFRDRDVDIDAHTYGLLAFWKFNRNDQGLRSHLRRRTPSERFRRAYQVLAVLSVLSLWISSTMTYPTSLAAQSST